MVFTFQYPQLCAGYICRENSGLSGWLNRILSGMQNEGRNINKAKQMCHIIAVNGLS